MKYTASPEKLVETEIPPVESRLLNDDALFVDFGKAAYGTMLLRLPPDVSSLVVHFGERLTEAGRIDRDPPGTIRYRRIEQGTDSSNDTCRMVIPPDERNTGERAILMPGYIGEVLPFRFVEIEDGAGIDPAWVRQIAVHYPFDDSAASFVSSDSVLNAVWDICKYTIKATTFCGVYVDGDRERIPYEGDAYINQLGHYCTDQEYALARYSHEYGPPPARSLSLPPAVRSRPASKAIPCQLRVYRPNSSDLPPGGGRSCCG